MLKTLSCIGATVVISLAFIGNAGGTATCVITIVSIQGASFLIRKLLNSIDPQAADIIELTSWALCAFPGVQVVKYAIIGIAPITAFFMGVSKAMISFGDKVNSVVEFFEWTKSIFG